MFRIKYVNNKNPIFVKSIKDKKRPSFIRYAMKCAKKIDVARSELNYTIQPIHPITGNIIPRMRRLNEHRARAMRAMVQAMLHHFNIASKLVMASIEQLSDSCGLSTISKSGNKSITRASRLITKFMEPMGFVTCIKIWDSNLGTYIPKMITLTPLFFMLFGISKKYLEKERKKQLKWINKNLINKKCPIVTLKKIRKNAKKQHIKRSLKYRRYKFFIKNKKKKALYISNLKEKDARFYILNNIVKKYTNKQLYHMGHVKLRKKVNIEYYSLRRFFYQYPP